MKHVPSWIVASAAGISSGSKHVSPGIWTWLPGISALLTVLKLVLQCSRMGNSCVCVCVCVRKIHTNAPATVLLSHSTVCHLRFGRCQSGPEAFRPRTIWAWAPQHIHMYIYIYIYIYMWIYLIAFMRCFLVDGAAQPVDKGTLSSCLFLIHEHLPERVIEREKEMENSCGALRGATLTM